MLPPGLGMLGVSTKALNASKTATMRRAYFDFSDQLASNATGYFPYTPPVQLLAGLRAAVDRMLAEGLDQVFARHSHLAQGVRAAVQAWGLELCAEHPALYSDTVTAIRVPAAVDAREVIRIGYERYNASFGSGLGPLAGKVFRIGHIGDCNEGMCLTAVALAELCLAAAGVSIRFGSGVAAAQEVYATRTTPAGRRMSHTLHPMRKPRLQRSELAVPASNPAMIDKAAEGPADYVFLDLEDAIAPSEKVQARKNALQALNDIDWAARGKTVSVRINGLDTQYMYRDVVDVMEQAGDRVHTLLVPKVGVTGDLYMVEAMVNQIEQAKGYNTRVGLEALIETALGMANVEAIAQFGGRLEALHFGVADFAASMRARTTNIGGLNPQYPGDQWHAAIARMVTACRAYGLRAIDGPFGDFSAPEGYKDGARRAAALGCEGKWAIHPSQVALANEVFSPADAEVTRARRIIAGRRHRRPLNSNFLRKFNETAPEFSQKIQ